MTELVWMGIGQNTLLGCYALFTEGRFYFILLKYLLKGKPEMKKKLTRILSVVLVLVMLFGISASAADTGKMKEGLAKWLPENITVSQAGGRIDSFLDWTVFAMARNGYTDYNDEYKAYIGSAVSKNLNSLYLNDYARIALAVMSIGMDPTDIGGTNLIDAIEKTDYTGEAYTGTIAYALVVLDSVGSKNDTARNALKKILLDAQREDGGYNSCLVADAASYWTISGETDSTGIALQALAPYKSEDAVKKTIDKALAFIKNEQMDDGGFGAWGAGSAESTSMIIAGLCAIGDNPDSYVKNGKTMIDALSAYVNEDGGGRCWDGSSNIMTSYEMLIGITAYERYKNGKIGVYDMSCLSPNCNSIEHLAVFERIPALGQILCKIVSAICSVIGIEYYCCKH